jgi:hypothetical protein
VERDPAEVRHPYHAYARLVRIGRWSMDELWRRLLGHLVERWVPDGPITCSSTTPSCSRPVAA